MAKRQTMSGEDVTGITSAYNQAISAYNASMGSVSVSDLLGSFNGNKSDLARALADTTGTKYASQMKNIGRWLAYESGERGPQARNPANSKTAGRFQGLYAAMNPPSNVSIAITGWIGYDDDFRHRSIVIPAPGDARQINAGAFVSAMRAGDTHAAYREAFAAYAPSLSVAEADSIDIQFD